MASMLNYILKKILMAIPLFFAITFLIFVLPRFLPGSPITVLQSQIGKPVPEAVKEALLERFDDGRPLIMQYFSYLGEILTGDFGETITITPGTPIAEILKIIVPRTIELTLLPFILSSYIGIKLGVTASTNHKKTKDVAIRLLSLLSIAMPLFWAASLVKYFTGYTLSVWTNGIIDIPVRGINSPGFDIPYFTGFRIIDCIIAGDHLLLWDSISHMILPSMVLFLGNLAFIIRQTRGSMLDVMQKDYIRTARAKGCKEEVIVKKHALKNTLIPTITILGIGFMGSMMGAVIVENVFDYYGMGHFMLESINKYDYWMLNSIILVYFFIVLVSNLLIDILYTIVDPRIRFQ